MKKFRFIIAAILTLSLAQGLWAIAPGGALGGGGKSAQAHPAQESKVIAEPVVNAPILDDQALEGNAAESPVIIEPTTKHDVLIGKTGSEGQSNQEVGEQAYRDAEADHLSKKEMRRNFKAMLQKMRESKGSESPATPLDDMLILCVILCFFLPPLAVYLYFGSIGTEFWISLLLTILFFVPGVIYSLYVILSN